MKRVPVIAIAAMACVAVSPVFSGAAGARLTWQQSGDASHFRVLVVQRDVADSGITEIDVPNPDIAADGTFATEVQGLDPLSAVYFVMVAERKNGASSDGSNMLGMESTDFCPVFDLDHDGRVTVGDALSFAREAVGLDRETYADPQGSIVSALDTLRLAAASQCS